MAEASTGSGPAAGRVTPAMVEAGVRRAIDYCGLNAEMTDGEIEFCVREILEAGLTQELRPDPDIEDVG